MNAGRPNSAGVFLWLGLNHRLKCSATPNLVVKIPQRADCAGAIFLIAKTGRRRQNNLVTFREGSGATILGGWREPPTSALLTHAGAAPATQ